MVEHRPQDPESIQMYEDAAARPERALWLRGPCLICGEWLAEDAEGVLWLALSMRGEHRGDVLAHAACVRRVAHGGAALPGLGG
jgi:hypothetical protein